jgi:hypothetical protein
MLDKILEKVLGAMEKFTNDIYGVYELINEGKSTKSIINTTIISKQYLAYYLYRIIAKFINLFEIAIPSTDINNLLKLLRIPKEHDRTKNYPLAGKMTNEEQLLDLIILTAIDMFNKVDKYILSLPNPDAYNSIYEFIKIKDLPIIIQDIIDLQKLIPGLSVSAIRPNYIDDEKLI